MNNSKIISTKRNSAIFLGTLLVLGTIATILPSAQAQQYYKDKYYPSYTQGYEPDYPSSQDNNYYKSKDSSIKVKKIKCNNINDNLNNVDVNSGLPNGNDAIAEDEGLATTAANGWGNGERNGNDFKFVCINNNDNENNVVVVNETTPEPPIPNPIITVIKEMFICSEPNLRIAGTIGTFTIFRIDCQDSSGMIPSPESPVWVPWEDCTENNFCPFLDEEDFTIQIEQNPGTNFIRYEFPGASEGRSVSVESGTYQVAEEVISSFQCSNMADYEDGAIFINEGSGVETHQASFCVALEGDYSGTIEAGEEKSCTVKNYLDFGFFFVPTEGLITSNINTAGSLTPSFSSPPTIAQGIGDSPELTATEKIAKLKQQCMKLTS